MTHDHSLSRRTVLTALTTSLTGLAGCLDTITPGDASNGSTPTDEEPLSTEMADDGRLVVTLTDSLEVGQVNLIQPNGELYAKRDVATGASQVTFDLNTTYQPGDYTIHAIKDDTTTAKTTQTIEPNLEITDVGLYRNHPDKPWDEVYGESETNTLRNGEAFVTVRNSGSGPDSVVSLTFTGDVPNPLANPSGNGIVEEETVRVPSGTSVDLYSSSFPFGHTTKEGMGCSPDGQSGEFTVTIQDTVFGEKMSNSFNVKYEGSTDMTDCSVKISES